MLYIVLLMSVFFNCLLCNDGHPVKIFCSPVVFLNKTKHEIIVATINENESAVNSFIQIWPEEEKTMFLTFNENKSLFESHVVVGWKNKKNLEVWEHSPVFLGNQPNSLIVNVLWGTDNFDRKILDLQVVSLSSKYMGSYPIRIKDKVTKID